MPERPQLPADIILYCHHRRHHHQNQNHAKSKPVNQSHHCRLQELCLIGTFIKQRCKAKNRGRRGQKYWPKAVCYAIDNGLTQVAVAAILINGGYQHNGIVDHDTRHPDQSNHRKHAHRDIPVIMPPNGPHQTERDHHHYDNRAHPIAKYPCQHQIDPGQTQNQSLQCTTQKLVLRLIQASHDEPHPKILRNLRQDFCRHQPADFCRPCRIVLGNRPGHRDHSNTVFTLNRRKSSAPRHLDDIGKRQIGPCQSAYLRAIHEIRHQLGWWQFHPNCRLAPAFRIACSFDPVQAIPHHLAQVVNRQSQSLPLRRQLQNQFVFVIGQRIFECGNFRELLQPRLQRRCCGFQDFGARTIELYINRVARRAGPETAKRQRFGHRMLHDPFLQCGDELGAGKWPGIRVDQFDGDRTQLPAFLGLRPRKTPTGVSPNAGNYKAQRINAVFIKIVRSQLRHRALHLAHHGQCVRPRGTRQHREIAAYRSLLGR